MEIIICYIIIFLTEALIIKQYCSTLFLAKYPNRVTVLTAIALYGILFAISFIKNPLLNAFSFLIANFIFLLFSFEIKCSTAIFHAIITTSVMALSELLVVGIVSNLAAHYYNPDTYLRNSTVLLFTSKPFYFLLLYAISHILIKTPKSTEKNTIKEIILLSITPFISFWVDLTLVSICCYTSIPPAINLMITITSILLLIANFVVYGIYIYSAEKNRRFTDLQLELQKESDAVSYYKMVRTRNESQNILIHDIKKHLQAIAFFNEQGNREKIADYISRLVDFPGLQKPVRMCDHEFLNAILCRYMNDCKEQQIDFHADIRSGTLDFISENDLVSLFGNLLDNAVEAAAKQPSAEIQLMVSRMPKAGLTAVTLVNSCHSNPLQKNGRLISTKKDRARHGYGLKSVERIVSRYRGHMKFYYEEQEQRFHVVITLNTSNLTKTD